MAKRDARNLAQQALDTWVRSHPGLETGDMLQGIALMRIGRILDLSFDRMCRTVHGISGADMRVLLALHRIGPPFELRPTDLFKEILVTSGTMTRQVDRLSAKGYVQRNPDARHLGGFLVSLTPAGLDAAERAVDELAHRSLVRRATDGMSARQKQQGVDYVLSLLDQLEAATNFGNNLPSR